MKIPARGFTHAGKFHADDVFATALLQILRPDIKVTRGFVVPEGFDGIVYDIGDGMFDHHREPRQTRPNGVPYAAFGLLWRVLGPGLVGQRQARLIDENFIQPLDLNDNTGEQNSLCDAIGFFNPPWDSADSADDRFFEAVAVAKQILTRQIEAANAVNRADEKVRAAYAASKDGIVVLPCYLPWKNGLYKTDALFVVYPSQRGGWSAQCVTDHRTKKPKLPFPAGWAGQSQQVIQERSGLAGISFCHASRFLITAADKATALAACRLAVRNMAAAEVMAPAYVYMARCAGDQLYTGWTTDPAARLHAHKTGRGARATRAFKAVGLAYLERCADKPAALRREAALKKLPKAEKEALCAAWAEQARPRLALATQADTADILALYNWYVCNRIATYQITPSTLEEYARWVEQTLAFAPLLVARDGAGRLLGYACAHPYHPREAFAWDAESTIYCAPDACGAGVGAALYGALLELLRRQGFWNVYALIADPNPASERFHEKFGFRCVGRLQHSAYKFGRWSGLSTWWLPLRKGRAAPAPTRALDPAEVADILAGYNR